MISQWCSNWILRVIRCNSSLIQNKLRKVLCLLKNSVKIVLNKKLDKRITKRDKTISSFLLADLMDLNLVLHSLRRTFTNPSYQMICASFRTLASSEKKSECSLQRWFSRELWRLIMSRRKRISSLKRLKSGLTQPIVRQRSRRVDLLRDQQLLLLPSIATRNMNESCLRAAVDQLVVLIKIY